MKKTVCVDLDGVLAKYDGWKGIDHIGDPIEGAVEFMQKLDELYKGVIFTTRCNPELNQLPVEELSGRVQRWLDDWGFTYDSIYTGVGKPICIAFIDDRALNCRPQVMGQQNYNYVLKQLIGM